MLDVMTLVGSTGKRYYYTIVTFGRPSSVDLSRRTRLHRSVLLESPSDSEHVANDCLGRLLEDVVDFSYSNK